MKRDSFAIPAAIIISAGLIAAAIYLSGSTTENQQGQDGDRVLSESGDSPNIEPVTEDDHIRGNPNAPVMIVEYSDYDCPFCKNFHETMRRIMQEYGTDGEVAWVYRHFPLEQLHPNAPKLAEAAECVGELGGDEAFWRFSDLIFDERGAQEQTDITRLNEFAEEAGVDVGQFELCYNSGKYTEAVQEDVQEAIDAGGRGTPHSVILVGDQQGVIRGAQPYNTVKNVIDNLLTQIRGGEISAESDTDE